MDEYSFVDRINYILQYYKVLPKHIFPGVDYHYSVYNKTYHVIYNNLGDTVLLFDTNKDTVMESFQLSLQHIKNLPITKTQFNERKLQLMILYDQFVIDKIEIVARQHDIIYSLKEKIDIIAVNNLYEIIRRMVNNGHI